MNKYFVSMSYLSKDGRLKGNKWEVVCSDSRMTGEFVQSVQRHLEEKYPDEQICVLFVQKLEG